MKLCSSAIVFLLPFSATLAASQTISGAADCVEARGFSLCQNVLADCTFTPLYASPSKRTNGSRCFYVPDSGAKAAQNSTHHRSAVSSIAWSTEYHWNTTDRSTKKSFPNVESKAAKAIRLDTLPVLTAVWSWTYKARSDQLKAVVGLDISISSERTRAIGSTAKTIQVQVWLSNSGGVVPLGSEIAVASCISGYDWAVWRGTSGGAQTITFLNLNKEEEITQFDGDIGEFVEYLTMVLKLPFTYYIQSIRAGTEVYAGTAELYTSLYTLWVDYPED